MLDACDRLRDRLLFAVLYDTGMRVGEALGLAARGLGGRRAAGQGGAADNDNGARSKSARPRIVPVSAELIRLYADYLHGEYGDCDQRLRVRQPVGRAAWASADLRGGL